jgi:hypothetical protein
VISGTPVVRPRGQRWEPGAAGPSFGPSLRLDFEAEVGFVAGVPSRHGEPVPVAEFERHVFGACLVNDWSARDIQAFETVPLGPFLGKAFATSVSLGHCHSTRLRAARTAPRRGMSSAAPARDSIHGAWFEQSASAARSMATVRHHVLDPARLLGPPASGGARRTGDLCSGTVRHARSARLPAGTTSMARDRSSLADGSGGLP